MIEAKEGMKVLVIGAGGREHAIITSLSKSIHKPILYAAPGNAGIAEKAKCLPMDVMDFSKIRDFCLSEPIDFVVVSPDDPLCHGLVDVLEEAGIPCFGPTKSAAQLEGSKAFAKEFMKKQGIPTAHYQRFDAYVEALAYVEHLADEAFPIVLKADGLALGKGVLVAESKVESIRFLEEVMVQQKFGPSGNTVIIEEYLTGPELSYFVLSDGTNFCPIMGAMDHKAVGEGNVGPNTGGMGVVAPNPYLNEAMELEILQSIVIPTIEGMSKLGAPFMGCLFIGLMLTEEGPKVIEYNCRFGDPETEAILPLLESDFLELLLAVRNKDIASCSMKFLNRFAVTVMLCSAGYPGEYEKGKAIHFEAMDDENVYLFHSATTLRDGKYYSNGGRVLALTAVGDTVEEARQKAYEAVDKIHFDGMFYRQDIGKVDREG